MQNARIDSEHSARSEPKTQDPVITSSEVRFQSQFSAPIPKDEPNDIQAGVQNIEAVSRTWITWSLIAAYIGLPY